MDYSWVPGPARNPQHPLLHFIFISTLQGRVYFFLCLSDKESEAQRGQLSCSRSCGSWVTRRRPALVILTFTSCCHAWSQDPDLVSLSIHVSCAARTFRQRPGYGMSLPVGAQLKSVTNEGSQDWREPPLFSRLCLAFYWDYPAKPSPWSYKRSIIRPILQRRLRGVKNFPEATWLGRGRGST